MACVVQDKRFLDRYRNCVEVGYFKRKKHRVLMGILLHYYDEHHSVPDKVVLQTVVQEWRDELKHKGAKELDPAIYDELIDSVFELDVSGIQNKVQKDIIVFAQTQKRAIAYQKALEDLSKGPKHFGEIDDMIDQARRVGMEDDDLGHFYFEEYDERELWRATAPKNKVPTGLVKIDKAADGGPGPGELWMLAAGTSVGKTTALVNLCKNAVLAGAGPAVYYSFEQSHEKIGNKLDCCWLGMTTEELRAAPADFRERMKKLKKKFRYQVIIKKYPSEMVTTTEVIGHLNTLKEKGIRPGVVFIDYPDLMLPPPHVRADADDHVKYGAIFNSLFNVATEFKCVVWVASDLKVEAFKKSRTAQDPIDSAPEVYDVGGAYKKSKKADGIITLSQTKEEREKSDKREEFGYRFRVHLQKTRDGASKETVDMLCIYAKSLWVPPNKATP